MVTGDCHRVRFRPSAAALFPVVAGREITPRATKAVHQTPLLRLESPYCAPTAEVDFMEFLTPAILRRREACAR